MLNTSELEFIFSLTYHQWIEDHGEQGNQGGLVCDHCGLPSTDGCLYNVPSSDAECDEELLVCHPCFQRVYRTWGGSKSWEDSLRVLKEYDVQSSN